MNKCKKVCCHCGKPVLKDEAYAGEGKYIYHVFRKCYDMFWQMVNEKEKRDLRAKIKVRRLLNDEAG